MMMVTMITTITTVSMIPNMRATVRSTSQPFKPETHRRQLFIDSVIIVTLIMMLYSSEELSSSEPSSLGDDTGKLKNCTRIWRRSADNGSLVRSNIMATTTLQIMTMTIAPVK